MDSISTTTLWITPLLLLPGVALLIMSTSVRYSQLHEEFHHLAAEDTETLKALHQHLIKRARLFRNALVSLYISIALLSLAGLLGGVTLPWATLSEQIVMLLTCLGILTLIFATVQLIRESRVSLDILCEHARRIM